MGRDYRLSAFRQHHTLLWGGVSASTPCATSTTGSGSSSATATGTSTSNTTASRAIRLRSVRWMSIGHRRRWSRERPRLQLRNLTRYQVRCRGLWSMHRGLGLEDTADKVPLPVQRHTFVPVQDASKDLILGLRIVGGRSRTVAGRRSNPLRSVAKVKRAILMRARRSGKAIRARRARLGTIRSWPEVVPRHDGCRTDPRPECRSLARDGRVGVCLNRELLAGQIQARRERNGEAAMLRAPVEM